MSENKASIAVPKITRIRYIKTEKNQYAPETQVWVNPINCKGIMGAGLAAEFKEKFPAMHEDYVQRCKREQVIIGEPYLYTNGTPWILNFPTKHHWRDKSKLYDIEKGLNYFVEHAKAWEIQSIAFPALGCGLGGLTWDAVYPVMYRCLQKLDGVSVEIISDMDEPPIEKNQLLISAFFEPKPLKKQTLSAQEKPQPPAKRIKEAESSPEASITNNTL